MNHKSKMVWLVVSAGLALLSVPMLATTASF